MVSTEARAELSLRISRQQLYSTPSNRAELHRLVRRPAKEIRLDPGPTPAVRHRENPSERYRKACQIEDVSIARRDGNCKR